MWERIQISLREGGNLPHIFFLFPFLFFFSCSLFQGLRALLNVIVSCLSVRLSVHPLPCSPTIQKRPLLFHCDAPFPETLRSTQITAYTHTSLHTQVIPALHLTIMEKTDTFFFFPSPPVQY